MENPQSYSRYDSTPYSRALYECKEVICWLVYQHLHLLSTQVSCHHSSNILRCSTEYKIYFYTSWQRMCNPLWQVAQPGILQRIFGLPHFLIF